MKQTDGKCELTLFSSMLAKDIFIETPLQGARYSDNFFDLLPGERKKVIITLRIRREKNYLSISSIFEKPINKTNLLTTNT